MYRHFRTYDTLTKKMGVVLFTIYISMVMDLMLRNMCAAYTADIAGGRQEGSGLHN